MGESRGSRGGVESDMSEAVCVVPTWRNAQVWHKQGICVP